MSEGEAYAEQYRDEIEALRALNKELLAALKRSACLRCETNLNDNSFVELYPCVACAETRALIAKADAR